MRRRTFPATKDSFSPLAKLCAPGSLRAMLGPTSTRIFAPHSTTEGLTVPKHAASLALVVSASAPAMSPASLFTFRARLAAPREPLAASRGSLPTPRPHLAARWGGLPAPQPCLTAPSVGLATFSPRPTAPRACLAALCLSLAATRPRPAAPRLHLAPGCP